MRKDSLQLKFDDDFLLESAQKRMDGGDYLGALTVLNKRERMNVPLADAYELYADIFEALELWPRAADAWFRFLDTCAQEEFYEGYEGLAVAFMNMGNEFQSGFYYRLAVAEDGGEPDPEIFEQEVREPALHLVHDSEENTSSPEMLGAGLALLKAGELGAAKEVFSDIPPESSDYASGAGLAAMCSLMMGEEREAQEMCERLMEEHPDNVQVLTTYCAVLGALEKREEAKAVAEKLFRLPVGATDDLYRVATALCETGLHTEAYVTLAELKKRLPYDENILWFYAASAYHVREIDEAIQSLETLTTIYPRKAVAEWYLGKLRDFRDGGEEVPMTYYYRLPEGEYRKLAAYLLQVSRSEPEEPGALASSAQFRESFHLAFDEMEGHDEKLQLLAAKVALKSGVDALIREVLLDYEGDDVVKLAILHDLVCRNAEESYGAVICNLYRELFIHRLEIGARKSGEFMTAFADVYAKFALLGEESEEKLCGAAEDMYATLAEAEAWELFDARAPLAAAIYREARLKHGERTLEEICNLFDADISVTRRILNFMM